MKILTEKQIEEIKKAETKDLRKKLESAWRMIEKLEEDNNALTNAARNAAFELDCAQMRHKKEYNKLKQEMGQLKADNKILRKTITGYVT